MIRRPLFTMPPNALKIKVGDGGIPANVLKMGQAYLENNTVDFSPYAQEFLNQLMQMRQISVTATTHEYQGLFTKILNITMQLKSNGSMFKYHLMTMVSDVMLRFLEKLDQSKGFNKDLVDILDMYIKVLNIIIAKKLTGNGGVEGFSLAQELHNACQRYQKRYDIP